MGFVILFVLVSTLASSFFSGRFEKGPGYLSAVYYSVSNILNLNTSKINNTTLLNTQVEIPATPAPAALSSCTNQSPFLWVQMPHEVDDRIQGLDGRQNFGTVIAPFYKWKQLWTNRAYYLEPPQDVAPTWYGSWARNSEVWTSRLTPIDFTGLSPWGYNDIGGQPARYNQRIPTLITPKHGIMANHFPIANSEVRFVDSSNNVIIRTVVSQQRVGTTDIRIVELNQPVPASIAHYSILSAQDLQRYFKPDPANTLLPLVMFNQLDRALIAETRNLNGIPNGGENIIQYVTSLAAPRSTFYEPLISGDSGKPVGMLINNKFVLATANEGPQSGPNYMNYLPQIQSAIDSLSPGEGYDVEPVDLTCFEQDTPPNFDRTSYTFQINQNYTAGATVGQVVAHDTNSSQDTVRYSLSGSNSNNFLINAVTGAITIRTAGLFNQNNPSLTFSVVAQDDWNTPAVSAPVPVTVTTESQVIPSSTRNLHALDDVQPAIPDTTPPVFGQSSYSFSISQEATNGSLVGMVSATDNVDPSPNYSIVAGNALNIFSIGQNTGDIRLENSGSSQFVGGNSFLLTVRATDSSNNSSSATAHITVTIPPPPPDTTPPSFTHSSYNFSISENARNGDIVGQVVAIDNIDPTPSYSIADGNSSNIFAINSSSGEIELANSNPQNFRANNTFALTIRARDSSGNQSTASVHISVITDIEASAQRSSGGGNSDTAGPEGGGGPDNGNPGGGGGGNNNPPGGGGGGGNGGGNQPNIPTPSITISVTEIQRQITTIQGIIKGLLLRFQEIQNSNQIPVSAPGAPGAGEVSTLANCPNMTYGYEGPCVKLLQKFLNDAGYTVDFFDQGSPGKESDYFGKATAESLKLYQMSVGISVPNGNFGPETRNFISSQGQ